jgi:colicin import membrane protein
MPAHSPIPVPPHRSVWAVPLSVIAHAGLVAALVLSVAWKSEPPAQLQAELWEAIPTPSAPAPIAPPPPPPEPEPVAKPEPVKAPVTKAPAPEPEAIAPKVVKKIVKKPEPQPDPEPEPPKKVVKPLAKVEPKPEVKPVSKPKPKPEPKPKAEPKPEPKSDTSAKDAARAKETERLQKLLGGAPVIGTPQAGSAQGLGAGWGAKLKACVQPNLRYSDASGDNPRVVFVVKLSPSGAPSDPVISKPSGNAAFDAAVSRALLRCDPFPKPESGGYPPSVTVAYRLND